MSRSLNVVHLIGHVGADPEVRKTNSGQSVANFSMATSRQWNDDAGNKQERTEWHRLTVWAGLADVVDRYVRKGDKLYVSGRIEYRQWTDNDGNTKYATDINVQELLMLGTPKGRDNAGAAPRARNNDSRPRNDGARNDDREDYADDQYDHGADNGSQGGEEEYEGADDDYRPREDGARNRQTQRRPARRPAAKASGGNRKRK